MSGFLATTTAGEHQRIHGRAIAAVGLGALVGLERQWRQRMAGLRTNALVALGAALFELFAVQLTGVHGVDPTRIAAYVVSGIGFLGAGVILRDGVSVRGINTAATIWCSAAVGVLAGKAISSRPSSARSWSSPRIWPCGRWPGGSTSCPQARRDRGRDPLPVPGHLPRPRRRIRGAGCCQALTRDDFVLRAVRSEDLDAGGGLVEVTAELQRYGRDDVALEAAVHGLSLEPSVTSVTWNVVETTVPLATAEE